MQRLLSVTNGGLLAVHYIASQESFVYFSSAAKLPVAVLAQTTAFAEQLLPPGASAQRSLRRWPSGAVRDTESLHAGFHLSAMRHQLDWT